MARPKRPPHPMLRVARDYLRDHAPDLVDQPLRLRTLDGPPGSPRYAVSVSVCRRAGPCPHQVADEANCPIHECGLRRSVRLLISRDGVVTIMIADGLRWQ